jgi:hypothetical protein
MRPRHKSQIHATSDNRHNRLLRLRHLLDTASVAWVAAGTREASRWSGPVADLRAPCVAVLRNGGAPHMGPRAWPLGRNRGPHLVPAGPLRAIHLQRIQQSLWAAHFLSCLGAAGLTVASTLGCFGGAVGKTARKRIDRRPPIGLLNPSVKPVRFLTASGLAALLRPSASSSLTRIRASLWRSRRSSCQDPFDIRRHLHRR